MIIDYPRQNWFPCSIIILYVTHFSKHTHGWIPDKLQTYPIIVLLLKTLLPFCACSTNINTIVLLGKYSVASSLSASFYYFRLSTRLHFGCVWALFSLVPYLPPHLRMQHKIPVKIPPILLCRCPTLYLTKFCHYFTFDRILGFSLLIRKKVIYLAAMCSKLLFTRPKA